MVMRILFVVLSTIVGIGCFVPYIRDIFLHKTTPHSYSWLVWAVLQTTVVLAMFEAGAGGLGILPLSIGAGLCGLVFLLSLSHGTKNITLFDTVCFVAALAAIAMYLFIRNPLLSVATVTLIDLVAFLPTLRKTYQEPHSETVATYFLSSVSSLFALGALATFTVVTSLFLVSQVIMNLLSVGVITISRKRKF